jgi:hypothetical protein
MVKIPTSCPICNGVMQYVDLHSVERKVCLSRIDHKISFSWKDHPHFSYGEEIKSIILSERKNLTFKWDFDLEKIIVYTGCSDLYHKKYHLPSQYQVLPYIDPDLKNWKKTINKLKNYLIFL